MRSDVVKIMLVLKDVHERKSSIEVELALRRLLDFPCFVQIVPDKIVAFEMAMLNYYDVIILPFTCEDPFTTAAFVEIISSIDDSLPSLIYMVNHDEQYEAEEKSKYIRMSAESTLNIRELVQAIASTVEQPSIDAVAPSNQDVRDVYRMMGALPPAAASLSIAPSPKDMQSSVSAPQSSRSSGGSKRKRSRKDAERGKSSRRAQPQEYSYPHPQGHGALTEAQAAAYHQYWQAQMQQQWQAQHQGQGHPQGQYMYPPHYGHGAHPDNLRDAAHGCTTSEGSLDGANDYLVTATSSSSDSEHDFDNMAGFDYGIILVDETMAFEGFE